MDVPQKIKDLVAALQPGIKKMSNNCIRIAGRKITLRIPTPNNTDSRFLFRTALYTWHNGNHFDIIRSFDDDELEKALMELGYTLIETEGGYAVWEKIFTAE